MPISLWAPAASAGRYCRCLSHCFRSDRLPLPARPLRLLPLSLAAVCPHGGTFCQRHHTKKGDARHKSHGQCASRDVAVGADKGGRQRSAAAPVARAAPRPLERKGSFQGRLHVAGAAGCLVNPSSVCCILNEAPAAMCPTNAVRRLFYRPGGILHAWSVRAGAAVLLRLPARL